MHQKTMFFLGLIVEMLLVRAAFGIEQCPVTEADTEKAGSYVQAVEATVQMAPNCERAFRITEACEFGDSKTNRLLEIVESKCEPLFLPRVGSATRKAYAKAKDRCDDIARRSPGTMYQSFSAVCRAGAAADFAHKYGQRKR